MTRSSSDSWSIARSLAFLAATFAIVFGSLAPFAALAAARPGQPTILCSANGTSVIATGGYLAGEGGEQPGKGMADIKCAACLLAASVEPSAAPIVQRCGLSAVRPASVFVSDPRYILPPGRASPRPPSTAPPHA